MQDVLQRNCMTLSAAFLPAEIKVDGANADDGNLLMFRDGQDVGIEGCIGLKAGAIDSDVDIGSRAEDPIMARRTDFPRFGGLGTSGEAQNAVARLPIVIVLALKETGHTRGGGSDGWRWQVGSRDGERQ